MTTNELNTLIDQRLASMTAADHVVATYEARTRHGVHLPEDRNDHFRRAAVATAKYLGRPLTADEINDAAERTAS